MSGSGQSASLWRALPGSVITVQPGLATWAQEYGLVITNGKWRHVCRRAANRLDLRGSGNLDVHLLGRAERGVLAIGKRAGRLWPGQAGGLRLGA